MSNIIRQLPHFTTAATVPHLWEVQASSSTHIDRFIEILSNHNKNQVSFKIGVPVTTKVVSVEITNIVLKNSSVENELDKIKEFLSDLGRVLLIEQIDKSFTGFPSDQAIAWIILDPHRF